MRPRQWQWGRPLSGKVAVAIIAYVVSWILLHFLWREKELQFRTWFGAALALVAIGSR